MNQPQGSDAVSFGLDNNVHPIAYQMIDGQPVMTGHIRSVALAPYLFDDSPVFWVVTGDGLIPTHPWEAFAVALVPGYLPVGVMIGASPTEQGARSGMEQAGPVEWIAVDDNTMPRLMAQLGVN